MKRVVAMILLLLVITVMSLGQNVKLTNLTVSNERSRTIFVGVDNTFLITDSAVTGIENQDHVSLLNGNRLEIKPVSPGYLTVVFLKNQETAQVIFYVKNIPAIVPFFGNQQGNKIYKDSLMVNDSIGFITEINDVYYAGYKIESFTAKVNKKTFASGPAFSAPLIKAIRSSKIGGSLEITGVKLYNIKINKSVVAKGPYNYILE